MRKSTILISGGLNDGVLDNLQALFLKGIAMNYSIIMVSELDRIAFRTDAEFYHPDHIRLSEKLAKIDSISIRKAGVFVDCSAFYPSIVPYYNFESKGVPFLRVNEIQDGLLRLSDSTVFLAKEILNENSSTIAICNPGDLVIAKGGNSLAKVALLTDEYERYSVCRDLIVLRTQALNSLGAHYLWMFLNSKIGRMLLLRTASQTGQPHLSLEAISRLDVPLIPARSQVLRPR
nr:hypothetical protein [Thiocapsa sp. KS1]